jgi:hypothetical protein
VIVGLQLFPVNGWVALALLACMVVKAVPACVRSNRDQRGINQEWGRVNQENFRRLYTEPQVRLDPFNQNPNAQGQILGDLMRWYFPTTANAHVETSRRGTLGWQRADEGSPWEPTVEVLGKQRVWGPSRRTRARRSRCAAARPSSH